MVVMGTPLVSNLHVHPEPSVQFWKSIKCCFCWYTGLQWSSLYQFRDFSSHLESKCLLTATGVLKVLNVLYNWLDLFCLINYAILAHSVSYILDYDSDPTQMNIAIGVLIGLFGVVFLAAVLLHIIVTFLKVCNKYNTLKERIYNHVFSIEHNHSIAAMQLEWPSGNDVINTDDCAVHEPLLFEDTWRMKFFLC